GVDQVKIYVDGYAIDSAIPDLALPASAAPPPAPAAPVELTKVASKLWRFTGGTMAIEFADHLTLFEVDGPPARIKQVIEMARQIVPGKPVTEVIVSHHHFDHSSGLREAVAEGLTVISRRDNGVIFREMTAHPATTFPDDLARSGRAMKFVPVDDHLQLKDSLTTLDIYHVIANNHMADAVFAYMPENKAMIEGDISTAAEDLQWCGDSWAENI